MLHAFLGLEAVMSSLELPLSERGDGCLAGCLLDLQGLTGCLTASEGGWLAVMFDWPARVLDQGARVCFGVGIQPPSHFVT